MRQESKRSLKNRNGLYTYILYNQASRNQRPFLRIHDSLGDDLPPVKMSTNYFTCTLGEAAVVKSHQLTGAGPAYMNINQLFDSQAEFRPNDAALGIPFPQVETGKWTYKLYSFNDLRRSSIHAASVLNEAMNPTVGPGPEYVALLCPSGINFVMVWLGLIRAGYSVLLIAPQCCPAVIAHLCKSCQAKYLVYDRSYTRLASDTSEEPDAITSGLKLQLIPWQVGDKEPITGVQNLVEILTTKSSGTKFPISNKPTSIHDIAYVHHTSGTSAGLPKLIPQTQYAAVGVQARLENNNIASFSTTPLYHGGIADCFRAWTSGALIWLFPESEAPITARNIIAAIRAVVDANADYPSLSSLRYFSSVPYVLQFLVEEAEGLELLQRMLIVGVGGAALPVTVGDYLVKNKVNLVSRYGTAELGFLLSSYRNFETDPDWQFLRLPPTNKYLNFERQDDGSGLSELVVLKGWPYMAKTNREDGSFATRDLFEPHPKINDAWRYHSRSDSQITLLTGKKFDPAPLEEEIASSSSLIREVLIFGNGQQRPGALVFPTEAPDMTDLALEEEIWNTVQQINSKSHQHARISRDLLRIMPKDSAYLERSSKGSLLRTLAEKKYAEEFLSVYEGNQKVKTSKKPLTLSEEEVINLIRETVNEIVYPSKLLDDSDFYHHGIDSGTCTQIRFALQKKFSSYIDSLPWNVVYDCGTIKGLAQYLMNLNTGKEEGTADQLRMMQQLLTKYSNFEQKSIIQENIGEKGYTIVLTGATGMLGSRVLETLREMPSVLQIICLLRAEDHESARKRISTRMIKNKKELLDQTDRILCWPSTLEKINLGLDEEQLTQLKQKATHVIHAAWPVNFSLPLRSFESQLAGVRHLIDLVQNCSKPTEFIFCSSTSSVVNLTHKTPIPEIESRNPSDADGLGYSRSKHVAEGICLAASGQPQMAGRVKILRVGQLTGDTETGIWNKTEAWPLMISTVKVLGCLPNLSDALNWLPVDIAARVVVELTLNKAPADWENSACLIYHVVNNSSDKTWSDLLEWLQEFSEQKFEVVDIKQWLSMLGKLESHPALQLRELWRQTYCSKEIPTKHEQIKFCTEKTESVSKALSYGRVHKELVHKIWCWLEESLE